MPNTPLNSLKLPVLPPQLLPLFLPHHLYPQHHLLQVLRLYPPVY
jgi:hypothetical protein